MSERRYSDDEVAAIFATATEGSGSTALQRRAEDGLTLHDLQQIGSQVGLAPDVVAHAALSLDLRPQASSQTFIGLPIGVQRTISLNRWLTDAEWDNLVGELRSVFRAKGKVSASGAYREWANGNLRASLEPSENGHRLRLSTIKGSIRPLLGLGSGLVATSAVVWALSIMTAHLDVAALTGILLLAASGLGIIASSVVGVKDWARQRAAQLESIATRVALPANARRLTPPPSND